MTRYLPMSSINWLAAFNRLFEMINSTGEAYHSGPDFLSSILPIDYSIPSYKQLIEERLNNGKSTSRKDFFYDILMSLSEEKRIQAYQIFINNLSSIFPEKVDGLKNELRLGGQAKVAVTQAKIPENIWNAEKLTDFLEKMDETITEKDYNRTLTLAYSCLEGLFKAYVKKNIPAKNNLDDLNPLAKEVKEHIKEILDNKGEKYPEIILSLIGTVTNAISNARNKFSESHFDGNAEEWLAEYARDNVNAIARLILKFI